MYSTIGEMHRANEALGHVWFSPETMRAHGTVIETGVIEGRYFITSDDTWNHRDRAYTIRVCEDNGDVHTHRATSLCQFRWLGDALQGLDNLIAGRDVDDDGTEDHPDPAGLEDDGDECPGHESLAGAHMGMSVYCDGPCLDS